MQSINDLLKNSSDAGLFFEKAIEEIGDGEFNPIEVVVILKRNISILESILKSDMLRHVASVELDKYHKSECNAFGATISTGSKTTYDFSGCNDSTYFELKKAFDLKKEQLSERENFLKSIKPDFLTVDEGSGECLLPPAKKVTDFFKVTFLK